MATVTEQPENKTPEVDAKQGRGGLMGKLSRLIAPAIVFSIVAVECLAAYLYLPSPDEASALVKAAVIEQTPVEPESEKTLGPDLKEVDMGPFTVTTMQASSNIMLRVDFHLYGTVLAAEEQEFLAMLATRQHRVRDHVSMTIRSADLSQLTDAGLGLIKRRILETTNKTLGKPFLQAVVFSEFTFLEQ